MRVLYRILTLIVNSSSKVIGNLKIIHPERLRDIEGCIISPNHIKASDAPVIMSIFQKEMYLIAKKELFDIPVLNILIKYVGAISVRRGQVDRKAIVQAKAVLEKGYILMVFPEGSRKLFTAKPGVGKIAFETQSDIVPVFIKYPKSWIKSVIRKESVYQEALEIELAKANIPYESQKELKINYNGIELKHYFIADLICYNKIILELKSVKSINEKHRSQIINYLKATNLKLGILINFGTYPKVQVERIVL